MPTGPTPPPTQRSWTPLDGAFEDFFAGVEDPVLVFGDRFPLRYFAERYGIEYYAAFPGCSTQTEPSAATIAFLTEKVETEHIGTVWYIEFSQPSGGGQQSPRPPGPGRPCSTPATT